MYLRVNCQPQGVRRLLELNDLNDSVHDDENVDVPTPGLLNNGNDENPGDRQISIANLSAG